MILHGFPDKESVRVLKKWNERAATLLNRDGTDARFPDGGHRIKQDPFLTHAIEQASGYYLDALNDKRKWLDRQRIEGKAEETERALQDIDYDLILLNKKTYEQLQKPNYGLSEEVICNIRASHPEAVEMSGLNTKDAAKITGSIIKRAIDTIELTYAREKSPRCFIPHAPLKSTPDKLGRARSAEPSDCGWTGYVHQREAQESSVPLP